MVLVNRFRKFEKKKLEQEIKRIKKFQNHLGQEEQLEIRWGARESFEEDAGKAQLVNNIRRSIKDALEKRKSK